MPYLRYSRDKRGYEHTYVLHGLRSGGRPRVLYWFRTPPNLAVGRGALDNRVMRSIESNNPELTFNWEQMRRERPKPPPRLPTGRREGSHSHRGRPRAAEAEPVAVAEVPAREIETRVDPPLDLGDSKLQSGNTVLPASHPVSVLLGDSALVLLRSRYEELKRALKEVSGIEKPFGEELGERIRRLNPDSWQAGEDVVLRLEQFDTEVKAIRAALDQV